MQYIVSPEKNIPVCAEVDLCVIGGSATGVFAAVRAARLGLKVALIEMQGSLGGVATNGWVNVWHTLYNTTGEKQIIAGLTYEVIDYLRGQGVVDRKRGLNDSCVFNSEELKCRLDNLIKEHNIKLYLHSFYAGVQTDGRKVTSVIMCGKDGMRAVKAGFVIDATGDGDIARDLGFDSYRFDAIQPPTPVFLLQGDMSRLDWHMGELFEAHAAEFDLGDDWGWYQDYPNCKGISMRADFHIQGFHMDRADDLTAAELEGRRKMLGMVRMLRKYGEPGEEYNIIASSSYIGVRDSIHFKTRYCANEMDLLLGKQFDDVIMQGTYSVDIHHAHDNGITFKYFDGSQHTCYGKSGREVQSNWRKELNIDEKEHPIATFYQVPFDILVGEKYDNFIAAGRMLNADIGSFGALRVMVNLNQLGEAAGVAAYLTLHQNKTLQTISGAEVRKTLRDGGSAL